MPKETIWPRTPTTYIDIREDSCTWLMFNQYSILISETLGCYAFIKRI